ncbi:hypothetical protein [Sulfolobus spindle-shaped virus]|nr:hypothetical protein [Sulfolobus spindle-shaped virus]
MLWKPLSFISLITILPNCPVLICLTFFPFIHIRPLQYLTYERLVYVFPSLA